jgi:alkanesulfonate monooxygenase SsuD/methylene tetrahydromethanopterin reductase-like flavin-dependent oxidoreductase (luciferase family)
MKFGLFFELSVPRPLSRHNEQQSIFNALEQARLADQLGFDYLWVVEHHFLEEYSHSSAPEVVLTAMAMQTERIRIGHGAVVCVPGINHPVRIAERTAMLDILSKGRLEVGTARSSTWTELGGFGGSPDITKASWDEYVHAIPQMWMRDSFSWEGVTFSMPERNVIPKPYQDPHPPLWVAVTTPGTELDAAERGMGCLGVSAGSFASQEQTVTRYRQAVRNCRPAGKLINSQVAGMNFMYCHEDRKQATAIGLEMVRNFNYLNTHQLWSREVYPTSAYRTLGNLAPGKGGKAPDDPRDEKGVPEGVTIGDPADLICAIKTWESTGVDSINFVVNAVETIRQKDVLASLSLFAREVMPAFKLPAKAAGEAA